jgi:hypothetical protein
LRRKAVSQVDGIRRNETDGSNHLAIVNAPQEYMSGTRVEFVYFFAVCPGFKPVLDTIDLVTQPVHLAKLVLITDDLNRELYRGIRDLIGKRIRIHCFSGPELLSHLSCKTALRNSKILVHTDCCTGNDSATSRAA